MTETVKTFCRNCSALCAMEIDVEDGRMTRARPDGSVSPYGAYLCPKGQSAVEFHNGAEDRLFQSLARQPDGSHAPVAMDDALDAIGAKLKALVAEYGPRCVAVYHGTGAYRSVLGGLMERAWVAALGTPNFFSTMTIDQSAKWVTMARLGIMASGRHNFRDTDVALLAGGNPLVTHQGAPFALAEVGAPARAFDDAKKRGCKIIIVDPRRTETARYADLFIQPLPGQDAVLFAAIAHVMLRERWYDAEFVSRWCNGLEEAQAAVTPFTPELAAERADVPVDQIILAARWLGNARRPYAGSGTGPSFSDHSNTADHMIELCNALAGGYRRAGDRVRNPGTLNRKQPYEMAVSPSRSFEHEPKCVSEDVGPLVGELPSALIPREIMAESPDRIRALISFGGDPLRAMGDPGFAVPAFENLDLLVSLDCRMNETGKLADYVVACSQQFERHEISVPGDTQYPDPFVQYTRPVVAKPDGVIHDHEFFWEVARRMNVPLTFKYWNYGLNFADIEDGLDLDMTTPPDGEELCRFLAKGSAVSFDELLANPGGVRPDVPEMLVEPAPRGARGKLELCPPDVAVELETVLADGGDDRFAFRLTSRRTLHTLNGAYRESKQALKRYPVNYAYMNPDDMADVGLADDDPVEIVAEYGALRTLVRAEARLRRGVISCTHFFGPLTGSDESGGNVGQLTSLTEHVQAINFMPRFSALPVNIRAVESVAAAT